MRRLLPLLALAAATLLLSCKDSAESMLPKSGGRPFEVLVVANDSAAGLVLDSVLTQSVPCLPQDEPETDVSLTDSVHLNAMTRLARNIVVVTVSPSLFTKTHVRYDKNVWAKGQFVVYINTPDTATLRRDMTALGRKTVSLIVRSELNSEIKRLTASRNPRADSMVAALTGMRMRVPADMLSSKRGKDFLWLSDNGNSGMASVCLYVYPGVDTSAARFRAMRDSIMRVNILGERDGMYMTTAQDSLLCTAERVKKRDRTIVRGLWEMHNDAMGGPFVAHILADTAHNRTVAAEAFVYAPGMKKRNLIRHAEAALYTLSPALSPQ